MIAAISDFFLQTLGRRWCVFLCSLLPVIELRGAIPLGAGFGLHPVETYLLAVAGNLLPVPFLLLLLRWILAGMKRIPGLRRIALYLETKAQKNRMKVEKYAFWGLFLFVAIPLPGTGAWTGSLVAALMRMRFPKALLSVIAGVMTAGLIMSLISYGVAAVFSTWF